VSGQGERQLLQPAGWHHPAGGPHPGSGVRRAPGQFRLERAVPPRTRPAAACRAL